jgi:hypothetical protein
MSTSIIVRVYDAPPAKDGGFSILNPRHYSYPRVQALRAAMRVTIAGRSPFVGVPLRLTMRYHRATSRSDALNIINGVADVIQRRCAAEYRSDVWLIDDDANIRAFEYAELLSDHDWYELTISTL